MLTSFSRYVDDKISREYEIEMLENTAYSLELNLIRMWKKKME